MKKILRLPALSPSENWKPFTRRAVTWGSGDAELPPLG